MYSISFSPKPILTRFLSLLSVIISLFWVNSIFWTFTYLFGLQSFCHLWTDGTLFAIIIFHLSLLLTKMLISMDLDPLKSLVLHSAVGGLIGKLEWPLEDLVKCSLRDSILKLKFCLIGCRIRFHSATHIRHYSSDIHSHWARTRGGEVASLTVIANNHFQIFFASCSHNFELR